MSYDLLIRSIVSPIILVSASGLAPTAAAEEEAATKVPSTTTTTNQPPLPPPTPGFQIWTPSSGKHNGKNGRSDHTCSAR